MGSIILLVFSAIAAALAILWFRSASTVLHEIQGLLASLTSAVLLAAALICYSIDELRRQARRLQKESERRVLSDDHRVAQSEALQRIKE
jgi:uncharacterized integral membrane protein